MCLSSRCWRCVSRGLSGRGGWGGGSTLLLALLRDKVDSQCDVRVVGRYEVVIGSFFPVDGRVLVPRVVVVFSELVSFAACGSWA